MTIATACLILLAATCFAQTTAAAPALDQSTPRGTLKLFLLASARSDGVAMRSLIQTNNPAEQRMAAAITAKRSADRELTEALGGRFADATQPSPPPVTDADLAPVFEKIEEAALTDGGDTATLAARGNSGPPFTLRRSGNKWMIPLSVLLQNVEPDFLAQQAHQIEIQIDVMRAAAADVKNGKYATRAEALEEIKKRMFDAAISDHVAAAGAATRP